MVKNQKALFDIIVLAALFAPAFLFIKIAAQEVAPITIVTLRVGIATLLLLFTLKIRNTVIPRNLSVWKHSLMLGFLINGLPFVCFSYSLTLIPISLSALINGTTPILTVFLAHYLLKDEPLTLNRVLAVILGLSGFLVLFLPALLKDTLSLDTIGILLAFIGACLYAVGAIYARKYMPKAPPLVAPTLQLLTSLIYLIPAALIFESPYELMNVSLTSWSAICGAAVFSTLLAFIMYHYIIHQHGATILSMSTFLLPIFGTLLGIAFFNETLSLNFTIAALLILGALGVINGMIPLPFIRMQPYTQSK